MKRLALLIVFLLLASVCQAQEWQEAKMNLGIIGGSSEVAAIGSEEDATGMVITCSWEAGTTLLNTGGGTGHVWAWSNATAASVDTGGNGWNGETSCFHGAFAGSGTEYGAAGISPTGAANWAARFSVQVNSHSMPAYAWTPLAFFRDSTHTTDNYELAAELYVDESSNPQIRGWYKYNGGAQGTTTGYTITLGVTYQVEMLWIANTAADTGVIIKVWNEAGTSLLATITGDAADTTNNYTVNRIGVACFYESPIYAVDYYIDIVKINSQATLLGPRTIP